MDEVKTRSITLNQQIVAGDLTVSEWTINGNRSRHQTVFRAHGHGECDYYYDHDQEIPEEQVPVILRLAVIDQGPKEVGITRIWEDEELVDAALEFGL